MSVVFQNSLSENVLEEEDYNYQSETYIDRDGKDLPWMLQHELQHLANGHHIGDPDKEGTIPDTNFLQSSENNKKINTGQLKFLKAVLDPCVLQLHPSMNRFRPKKTRIDVRRSINTFKWHYSVVGVLLLVGFSLFLDISRNEHGEGDAEVAPWHAAASALQNRAIDSVKETSIDRKYYIVGGLFYHQCFELLHRILHQTRQDMRKSGVQDQICEQSSGICDFGQVKFLNHGWPGFSNPSESPSSPGHRDGCADFSSTEGCFKSFFGGATENDVLVLGSKLPNTFDDIGASHSDLDGETLKSVDTVLKLFPGTILYHSFPSSDARSGTDMAEKFKNYVDNSRILQMETSHGGKRPQDVVRQLLDTLRWNQDIIRMSQLVKVNRICGSWADEYIAFHRYSLQALKENPKHALKELGIRLLVFKPNLALNQGYADRIAGMQKAFLLAYCSQRVFLIDWPAIQDIFKKESIDWSYEPKIMAAIEEVGEEFRAVYEKHEDDLHGMGSVSMESYLDSLALDESNPVTSMHFNRPATTETLEKTKCGVQLGLKGLSENNLFGCIMQLLLVPKDNVLLPYMRIARDILNTKDSVGLQLRFGDDVLKNGGNTVEDEFIHSLVKRADCFTPYSSSINSSRFFLMTDNAILKRRCVELYPLRFYMTDVRPKHVGLSTSSAEYSELVAEWFLFSLNKFHLIDERSGLGRTSYGYSLSTYPSFFTMSLDCTAWLPINLNHYFWLFFDNAYTTLTVL